MSRVNIVAIITAEEGKKELVRSQIDSLVAATRKEEGNLQYDLHTDNEVDGRFVIYETYQNAEAIDSHMKTDHFQGFMKATEGAIAKFDVYKLSKVD